ncbi:hypothetical protein BBK82_03085 [Lentzea guizhouensis]|uniref:Uncharacterized protein n=1 Tax=Lentzea guizhouensis TaxID=1586287 RepID=A0A1B2HBX1_9PSEU|nr:hypothetical protein [Lentzea guizhouensis]ANZ35202.1 hypothetical protein BBK82_03085 [Lentzea guizhouensis]
MSTSWQIFNAVADALIQAGATEQEKKRILAGTMDVVGVPLPSFSRYSGDATIVELFGERGVQQATPERKQRG